MILLNARAAARPELGGVERWARELAARLPQVGPYEVIRPPAALSHRAGHAWEQAVLPARARKAELLLNPANLAPIAFPRNVVVIHDAAALRDRTWYSPAYAALQRRLLPLIAKRARLVITVSEFSRRELQALLGVDAKVVPGGVDERFRPDADPEPARAALNLSRPPVPPSNSTARTSSPSQARPPARTSPHSPPQPGDSRRRASSWSPPAAGAHSSAGTTDRSACGRSATYPTTTSRASTPALRRSSCPRGMRASG